MRERKLEALGNKRAKERGFLQYKFLSSVIGVPDRIYMKAGHVFFVEYKTETGVLTVRQMREHEKIKHTGIHVYVIRNENDIDRVFK